MRLLRRLAADQRICYVLFAFVPLVAAMLYCLLDLKTILDISLPNGTWNDEVSYYKQIEGMIHYGIPRGYFAYNDSSAPVGTMGPWCILLFFPYVVIGRLTGWNYLTPVICNIIFLCIGFGAFAWITKKKPVVLLGMAGCYLAMPMVIRYTVSGMAEPLFYMGALLFAACVIRMREDERMRFVYGAFVVLLYMTVIRPYFVIFMLIPAIELWKRKRQKGLLISMGFAAGGMLLYVLLNSQLCAPYFIATIDYSSFTLLREGHPLQAAAYMLTTLKNGCLSIVSFLRMEFSPGGFALGEMWLTFLLLAFLLIVQLFAVKKEKRGQLAAVLVSSVAVAVVILVFYSPNMGARHILICCCILLAMLTEGKGRLLAVQCVLLLTVCFILPKEDEVYRVPYQTAKMEKQLTKWERQYEELIPVTEDCSWDNSVMWVMTDSDREGNIYYMSHAMLYALPKGSGISITQNLYVLQQGVAGISSRYILTPPKGQVADLLKSAGATRLAKDKYSSLWLNPAAQENRRAGL